MYNSNISNVIKITHEKYKKKQTKTEISKYFDSRKQMYPNMEVDSFVLKNNRNNDKVSTCQQN